MSGIVSSIGGKAVELGKGLLETVVETATFQESTIKGLTTTFKGNEGTAKSVYDYALGLAKKTPLETDYIITSIRTLVETGGFDVSESKYLVKAVADIASKYGGDEGLRIGEQLTTNLSRVKARGYATTRDIGESLLAAKISPADVAPELAKILNIKEKDPLKQTVAVREALSHAGKVGANDFINALTASLEKKAPLGEYAEKQSQTWGGVISNLKAAFTDLLKSADLSRWPGLKSLKDFFLRVTHVFDPVEGAGQEILGTVDRVLGNILKGLDNITEKDIVGFVETIGDVAETIATGIQKVWGWLDRLLHSGSAAGAIDELGDILVDVGAYIGAGIWQGIKGGRPDKTEREYGVSRRGAEAAAKYQGRSVADVERDLAAYKAAGGAPVSPGIFSKFGFNPLNSDALKNTATIDAATQFAARQRQGTFSAPSIQDLVGEAYGTGQNLALGMIQGAKDAGEIRSPSRKMMRLGENLVQGAVQGFDKASDQATKSGGGGGMSLSVTMPLVVMGSVDDPDQLAGALEAPVTKLFTSMMERLASEYGYARA